DLHLHVCSDFATERAFQQCYARELFQTPNVHPHGRIAVNGAEFYELARRCGYVIGPSCSEGQSGAIVQGMHAGLVPVVTPEAGVDTGEFGVTFAGDGLDHLEKVIVELAGRPGSWVRTRCLETRRVAEREYSEAAFVRRWRAILDDVLADDG